MITIHKYPLNNGRTTVMLPMSHRIIKSEMDPLGVPCVWVWLDNSDPPIVARNFALVGTGQPAPNPFNADHINSFRDGPYMWHVFVDKRL